MVKAWIYIFGAQNSGKSTQMIHLGGALEDLGHKTLAGFQIPERTDGSIARRALSKGFTINETSDFDTQYDICLSYSLFDFESRKQAERTGCEFAVFDRTILDHLIYAWRHDNISIEDKVALGEYAIGHALRNRVDYGFLAEPIPHMEADGSRSVNKDFQNDMHERFVKNIIQKGIGERTIGAFFKNLYVLPYAEGFSKEESLRLRTEFILEKLRKDGLV